MSDKPALEPLPTRTRRPLPGGRHRRAGGPSLPPEAPFLVLVSPYRAEDSLPLLTELDALTRAACPGADVRLAWLEERPGAEPQVRAESQPDEGAEDTAAERGEPAVCSLAQLLESLVDAEAEPEQQRSAVLVPLLLTADPAVQRRLAATAAAARLPVTVAEPLGPHPLLAEALHSRLAEAGLARADRIRFLGVVTAADGIVVLTRGGAAAVATADATGILLAARLAVPVIAADSAASTGAATDVTRAVDRLREAGSTRPVLAPCLLGPELDGDRLDKLAAAAGCERSAPLGAQQSVAQLVAVRYAAAMDRLEGLEAVAARSGTPGSGSRRHGRAELAEPVPPPAQPPAAG